MNAPLVVVQGDLLLPTLYPLAGMPNAVYGEEWTLKSARPALTEYEIPFYAARFLTAYVSPISLRNERFPYTPASLWGKFRRNDEMLQTEQTSFAAAPVDIAPAAPEPASFAFEPFTAPDDRVVKTPPANDRRKQVAGGAIALACAAFIAWALFGTRIGHQKPEQAAMVASNATPAADASSEVVAAEPSAVSSVPPSSSATVSTATSGSHPAEGSSKPSAVAAAALTALQTPSAPPATTASTTTAKPSPNTASVASNSGTASAGDTSARVTKPQVVAKTKPLVVAQASERGRAKSHGKNKRSAAVIREARSYEVVQRRHGHEYQGTPVYRSSGFDAPLASPGRRAQSRDDMRTASSGSSLSVTEMYNMLAHSAVLDDNSGVSRQTVRASSVATPRSGSGDSSNWSSDISQRRVTEPGSQFLK
ncbi:hypothetical protein [uncultured Caballeronia sp.]|uniref:hypothetical protein n=1 Tax=uncultured Caballeronia sp. TaxID=1827198 RepID=UPI0035CC4CC6